MNEIEALRNRCSEYALVMGKQMGSLLALRELMDLETMTMDYLKEKLSQYITECSNDAQRVLSGLSIQA